MQVHEIADRLNDDAENIMRQYLGEPDKRQSTKRELRWDADGKIRLRLDRPGKWCNFSTDEHGDMLDFIEAMERCSKGEAVRIGKDILGIRDDDGPAPKVDPQIAERRRIEREQRQREQEAETAADEAERKAYAAAVWRQCAPLAGSLAERYLRARLGETPPCEAYNVQALRFHGNLRAPDDIDPDRGRLPAMVALMTDPLTNEPTGIHRTWLDPDTGRKLGRKMLGPPGVVRLTRDEDVTAGLGLGEGIESTLSVISLLGFRPIWAALSAGGIGRFPILSGVEALTIFSDHDPSKIDERGNERGEAGQRAALQCQERYEGAGAEVRIFLPPSVKTDFNDIQIMELQDNG